MPLRLCIMYCEMYRRNSIADIMIKCLYVIIAISRCIYALRMSVVLDSLSDHFYTAYYVFSSSSLRYPQFMQDESEHQNAFVPQMSDLDAFYFEAEKHFKEACALLGEEYNTIREGGPVKVTKTKAKTVKAKIIKEAKSQDMKTLEFGSQEQKLQNGSGNDDGNDEKHWGSGKDIEFNFAERCRHRVHALEARHPESNRTQNDLITSK
jgi:hypothetical protein